MKATRPRFESDVSNVKKLNGPGSVRAISRSAPPRPRRIASPSSSSVAANETWPSSFRDGLRPRKSNAGVSVAIVVRRPLGAAR
jgi:hypothetical protein